MKRPWEKPAVRQLVAGSAEPPGSESACADTAEARHERDCAYVTSDGPAPCTCKAGLHQLAPQQAFDPAEAARRSFAPNPDHTRVDGMRRSIHRSHRGTGFNFVD